MRKTQKDESIKALKARLRDIWKKATSAPKQPDYEMPIDAGKLVKQLLKRMKAMQIEL